jgi:hypothetical protein
VGQICPTLCPTDLKKIKIDYLSKIKTYTHVIAARD